MKHDWRCNFTSVVDQDALVRLLASFVEDVECYCSENPNRVCPVHEADDLLKQNDLAKAVNYAP